MKLAELTNHFDEVQDWNWNIDSYIKFVMGPLEKVYREMSNDAPHKDDLLTLLSSSNDKLREMADCIQRDVGRLKIRTRSSDHGCFLGEEVIKAYIESPDKKSSVRAQEKPHKNLCLVR